MPSNATQDQLLWSLARDPMLPSVAGVECTSCHTDPSTGRLLASKAPSELAQSQHAFKVDPTFGTEQTCARCHQFQGPDPDAHEAFALTGVVQQDTVHEWAGSAAAQAGTGCVDCHMPQGSHAFPGGHDASMVRGAVSATVRRSARDRVTAVIRAQGVGHAVPTGDPFRRLSLRLCADPACTIVIRQHNLMRRETGADSRLPLDTGEGSAVQRSFVLEPVVPKALWWELRLFYGDPDLERLLQPHNISLRIDGGPVQR